MTQLRHRLFGRQDFPSSLQGGEARDAPEHRIGETERQSPRIDKPDPGSPQPQPEREVPLRPQHSDDGR